MRYTLRLLTLDQLGRAAMLICALELERQNDVEKLGPWPFEIGLWVVIDGGYTKRPFLKRALQTGVTIVGRLRKDAALRDLPPKQKKRGRSHEK